MALHKVEIKNGEVLLDETLAGSVATSPPEGIRETAEISESEGVLTLKVKWMVERSPDQVLPLELFTLRLDEFYPYASFIGGRRYESAHAGREEFKKLGFPYNTYFKYRIQSRPGYDAALFTKMPISCWQEKYRSFAVVFPKVLTLPRGELPLFIRASGAEANVDFTAAILPEFDVIRKPFGWFSAEKRTRKHSVSLQKGEWFEAAFLLVAADTWAECVRACLKHMRPDRSAVQEPSCEHFGRRLQSAIRYYDRLWDAQNRTHMHLPVKNVPGFESVEMKHSHITDDLTKLVLYRRLADLGWTACERRERELLSKLTSGAYLYELNGSRLWHTTTYFNGTGTETFTHHGIGFVGFPGGMATVVRRMFEYCSLAHDDTLGDLAAEGADWLVKTQCEDGSWPAALSNLGEITHAGCVASSAETARALIAAHVRTEKQRYRDAVAAAMRFVNRDESFFECRQYLRDVDADEADGITAEACIHANLDWHALAGDSASLKQAEKWATYALQWIRPRSLEMAAEPSFDGLARSITPRIDVWGGLLIARAFMRLWRASGDGIWREYASQLFENIAALQERDGGFCETWFLDFPSGLESIHIEPTFVTDAFVEFLLDACSGNRGDKRLAEDLRKSLLPAPDATAPLAQCAQEIVEMSDEQPQFIIDQRLRLALAFDGPYHWSAALRHALYTMLREVRPGRYALKLAPAAKILLNRHRVKPPVDGIGATDSLEIMTSISLRSTR